MTKEGIISLTFCFLVCKMGCYHLWALQSSLVALQYLGGKYLYSQCLQNLTLILLNISTRIDHAFRLLSYNEISLLFCKVFVLIYLILIVHPLGLSPSLSTSVCSDIFLKSE